MKQEEVFDAYLEKRLREWGNYYSNIMRGNAGYPGESAISKIMILGILITSSQSKSKPPLKSHHRAEEVQFWLKRMAVIYPSYSDAIGLYYLNPEIPRRFLANDMNVSIRTFNQRVKDGKLWLNGLLTAFAENELVSTLDTNNKFSIRSKEIKIFGVNNVIEAERKNASYKL